MARATPLLQEPIVESIDDIDELGGQQVADFDGDQRGDVAVEGLGDAARDRRLCVRVTPQRYREPNRILETGCVEEGDDRFRNGALARHVPLIAVPYLVDVSTQVVVE